MTVMMMAFRLPGLVWLSSLVRRLEVLFDTVVGLLRARKISRLQIGLKLLKGLGNGIVALR